MKKRLFALSFVIAVCFLAVVILLGACMQDNNADATNEIATATPTPVTSTTTTTEPTPAPTAIPEPTATPEPTPTPEPVTELHATAYSTLWSSDFTFYSLDNESYRTVQDVRLWENGTETLSGMSIYVPEAAGLVEVKIDMTADKSVTVPVTVVDMNGNTVTGDSMSEALTNGGSISVGEMQYDLIFQIRLSTTNGVFVANVRIC